MIRSSSPRPYTVCSLSLERLLTHSLVPRKQDAMSKHYHAAVSQHDELGRPRTPQYIIKFIDNVLS